MLGIVVGGVKFCVMSLLPLLFCGFIDKYTATAKTAKLMTVKDKVILFISYLWTKFSRLFDQFHRADYFHNTAVVKFNLGGPRHFLVLDKSGGKRLL